ncbi:FAD-dependent monooxygenase, partial [Bradyrhizobium ottawaense]
WFDPPFHRGQSVLLHRQADKIWRIDFQLGWDADPDEEKRPERVIPRIRAMLGEETEFALEWVSIYQFACRRIDNFRQGRVLFAGDAAHQVSPFGARGANTGVQDIDNLAWKLAMVLRGEASEALLDSYHEERAYAADDNILNSTRATDFITPKTRVSRYFRDAVLELARHHGFARPLVNSGRLSTPTPYATSALNTPDGNAMMGGVRPGTNAADAPITVDGKPAWFLHCLGDGFTVVAFGKETDKTEIAVGPLKAKLIVVGRDIADPSGLLAARYGASPGTTYLFRPDQYVAARWTGFDEASIADAMLRASGHDTTGRKELAA